MREEMKDMREIIRGTKGKITPYGFTTNEICEIIEQDNEEAQYIEELYGEWKKSLPSKEEREQIFPEVTKEQRYEFRRRFLEQRYAEITKKYFEALAKGQDTKKLLKERFHRKVEYEIFTYRPKDDTTIPPHVIAQARQTPIEKFIEHKKYFALCPFHQDHSPSMYIRNNFYFCFSCNAKGDVIDFVMKIKSLTFPQTIKFLS